MDRRVTDPGAEEEDGHPEREEADALQLNERTRFRDVFRQRDDGRHRHGAEARLQVLAPTLAPVLRRRHVDGRRKSTNHRRSCTLLRFLNDRRERNQGGHAVRRGAIAAEPDLVQGPLAEAAEPAVKRRVVWDVHPGGLGHGASIASAIGKISAAEFLDPLERILLVGKEVAGENAPAAAALVARDHGHGENQRISALVDERAGDKRRRYPKRFGAAASARDAIQEGLDQSQILEIDGPHHFGMVDGQHVRQRA